MRFLVTGSPRSATKYAARLLGAMGIRCGHESLIVPQANLVDWLRWFVDGQHGESSWMAWAALPLLPGPVPVLHTVRNPWHVIDSLANRNSILRDVENGRAPKGMVAIRDVIRAYCPHVWDYASIVERAAAFVVEWNRLIVDSVPGDMLLSYRCESLTVPMARAMLRHIGFERDDDEIASAIESVKTTTNEGFTVVDIPTVSDPIVAKYLKELAVEQGAELFTRRILNTAARNSPEELAAQMSPELVAKVNDHAAWYGYEMVGAPIGALAE